MTTYRKERDSLGEVQLPASALYGAQTQRAIENFPISGITLPPPMIHALGLIKQAAAVANGQLGELPAAQASAIARAAGRVAAGELDEQFPVDIFQTGSGTSSNMNCNEVIAHLASQALGEPVHPNDQVNRGQSSNDVFPSAIYLAARLESSGLLQALAQLEQRLTLSAEDFSQVIKTGRTHLMDALPLSLGQELGAWAAQIGDARRRLELAQPGIEALAIGGTAIGSGANTHPEFAAGVIAFINQQTGGSFREADNHFAAQAAMDAGVAFSGQLKACAVALIKIANDLRWMNSGPVAGLAEVKLPALQPGSSIMPGKINPVIPEAVAMAATQVIGNDTTITLAGQSGSFQLNTMLPLIGHNLLQSIQLLTHSARVLADKAIAGIQVNEQRLEELAGQNAILATALAPEIGYDLAANLVKRAMAEGRSIRALAEEQTDLDKAALDRLLDLRRISGLKD